MNRAWTAPVTSDRQTFDPADVFAAGLRNHHIANTAYPIAHNHTWGPYRVKRARTDEVVTQGWAGIDDLCLYVHIPFCEVRCSFCEYTIVGKQEHAYVDAYMNDLIREFDLYRVNVGAGHRLLHGLDIGGGTPSFVPADWIARVVEKARACFRFAPDADISIETTPRIAAAEPEKITAYKRVGVDRISMGIQVIQPDLLRVLNRSSNSVEHHFRAVEHIRRAGFDRLNVDLMYGFAGQSLASWRATLQHAIDLGPEYITLYRMRYKLTRISHQAHQVTLHAVRPMIVLAKEMLHDAGYLANPGKTTYSRVPGDVGTSSYLARRVVGGMPYLGLGLGAQSYTHTTISYNEGAAGKNLTPYRRRIAQGCLPVQDLYDLPACHMMAKMCCVSFYFGEIDLEAFEAKFGVSLEEVYPVEVRFLLDQGMMEYTDRALSLTKQGALHKNGVIALFHAPSVKQYLIERDPNTARDFERNRKMAVRVARRSADV